MIRERVYFREEMYKNLHIPHPGLGLLDGFDRRFAQGNLGSKHQ
jgi:hypothetical protein